MIAEPLELFRTAMASPHAETGYYHKNVSVDTPSRRVIVRIPIDGADEMDLRIWPEHEVLRAIVPYVDNAPRLLHVSQRPEFTVYEFVDGTLVDTVAPRGEPVPEFVLRDVVDLFGQLATVPPEALPPTPTGWPTEDTAAFGRALSRVTERAYARSVGEFGSLFAELGVPADPLEPVREAWSGLSSRPFRLVHADVHRKNMIASAGRAVFLDWELALCGDPLYDLAVHLHKMSYLPHERDAMVAGWLRVLPDACTHNWRPDLEIYLRHERVKSAVVDTVRYSKQIAAGSDIERQLLDKLTDKLNAAREVWGRREAIERRAVEDAVRAWGCTPR